MVGARDSRVSASYECILPCVNDFQVARLIERTKRTIVEKSECKTGQERRFRKIISNPRRVTSSIPKSPNPAEFSGRFASAEMIAIVLKGVLSASSLGKCSFERVLRAVLVK